MSSDVRSIACMETEIPLYSHALELHQLKQTGCQSVFINNVSNRAGSKGVQIQAAPIVRIVEHGLDDTDEYEKI